MEEKIEYIGHSDSIKAGINLEHPFFAHVSQEEKAKIYAEIMSEKAYIVSLKDGEQIFGAAILSVEHDRIHVWEVGGEYLRTVNRIKPVAGIVAMKLGKKFVSFDATDERIRKRSERYGFKPDPNNEKTLLLEVNYGR